jgi:uncharacterized cupredoxin-like copper-binding protein
MTIQTFFRRAFVAGILALFIPLGISSAFAAGKHGSGHGHGDGKDIGKPGKTSDVTRTIEIIMKDNFYEPESLTIKEGETIRFVIKNAGELVHEFNIATAEMHVAHQPEMMMMMEHGVLEPDRINWDAAKKMQETMGHGMHNEPNSVLLEPGKSGEMIWTFPAHTKLQFGCNVPGHYDAGMQGDIKLTH